MRKRASALIFKESKLLLIHRFRDGSEYWVIPGGGVEEGETIEEALGREVEEELSLRVKDKEFIFQIENDYGEEYHYLVRKYEGELKLGGPEAEASNERNQYILTWVSKAEFEGLKVFYPKASRLKILAEWDIMAS